MATSPEGEEAVAEAVQALSGQPASSYTDLGAGTVSVSVYLPGRPSRELRSRVRASLQQMERVRQDLGPGRVSVARVASEDWAESWKRHFKPLEIRKRLLVKPSWSRRRARKGEAVVVLDPGLSFGTGQHPTTGFCLRELVSRRRPGGAQSLLDIGTGSGILAIAADKLGYRPVDAFDFDEDAVRVARANARQNSVTSSLRFFRGDLTRMPRRPRRRYSVICANLISTLLISERERIGARLEPGGVLLVAGILREEFGEVESAFGAMGLRRVKAFSEKEWRSGSFRFF